MLWNAFVLGPLPLSPGFCTNWQDMKNLWVEKFPPSMNLIFTGHPCAVISALISFLTVGTISESLYPYGLALADRSGYLRAPLFVRLRSTGTSKALTPGYTNYLNPFNRLKTRYFD